VHFQDIFNKLHRINAIRWVDINNVLLIWFAVFSKVVVFNFLTSACLWTLLNVRRAFKCFCSVLYNTMTKRWTKLANNEQEIIQRLKKIQDHYSQAVSLWWWQSDMFPVLSGDSAISTTTEYDNLLDQWLISVWLTSCMSTFSRNHGSTLFASTSTAHDAMLAQYKLSSCVCSSVCPSVTSQYCTMAKHSFTETTLNVRRAYMLLIARGLWCSAAKDLCENKLYFWWHLNFCILQIRMHFTYTSYKP